MVKERIRNTYNFMKDKYQTTWNVACCNNANGSCEHCGGRTLAYVMGSSAYSGSKTSSAWIRMCKLIMDMSDYDIGLTLYHEL
jgi:hypothetical protein